MENSKYEHWNQPQPYEEDNKRIAAGLLAIILGPFGIHKFLLGYTKTGIFWLFSKSHQFWRHNRITRTYRRHYLSDKIR